MEPLERRVVAAVGRHPAVREVRLVGSRAEGRATERSDWDFRIETDHFDAVADELPRLCAPLEPLAEQWDPLNPQWCWMLMLRGPTKVDLLFAKAHRDEPPWDPTRDDLAAIDRHFWDWALWLRSKEAAGRDGLVAAELEKLFRHLLAPLGVRDAPASVAAALAAYRRARDEAEERLGRRVPRELEHEVAPAVER